MCLSRETGVSRHQGAQLRAPWNPVHHSTIVLRGFRRYPTRAPKESEVQFSQHAPDTSRASIVACGTVGPPHIINTVRTRRQHAHVQTCILVYTRINQYTGISYPRQQDKSHLFELFIKTNSASSDANFLKICKLIQSFYNRTRNHQYTGIGYSNGAIISSIASFHL